MKSAGIIGLVILINRILMASAIGDQTVGSYSARGVIQSIAPDRRQVTIHHQAIPGYMMEMTMDFPVQNTNELTGLVPGDEVNFKLIVREKDDWIKEVHRVGHVGQSPAIPKTEQDNQIRELKPGDPLPNDELLTENGQAIHFSDFRGKALAFTFFFTRCPLPDFCPRMNRDFSETRQVIRSTKDAPENWALMSISFDPDFDTPKTLAGYASFYRGSDTSHWLFASAPTPTLRDLAPRLDLMVMRQGGSISHNLRTVVLDPEGRIFRQFDGNQWTPRELADAILEAARIPAINPGRQVGVQTKTNP